MSPLAPRRAAGALAALLLIAPGLRAQEGHAGAEEAAEAPLACLVSGYDVVVRNQGLAAVPLGTELGWAVPYARKDGVHVLDAPLGPGGQVVLTGVLGSSYLDSRKPCSVTLP